MKKHFFFSLVFAGIIGFQQTIAQSEKDSLFLDNYIRQAVEKYHSPGLAVGIIKNGKIVLANGYGYRNTETGEKVDENTLFGIASCSKAFTAACIAILVDEEKLNWDDKLIDVYPEFQAFDPYITRELTIRDLLCHRAGYETFDGDLIWYGTDYNREEVVHRMRYVENPYSLREKFGYSNVMYITAGEVILAVTGQTWDEFLTENIFTPLSMNESTTTNSTFTAKMNVAVPHIDSKPVEFISYDNISSAGAINSSVSDMLKWEQLMLGKGIFGGDTIFSSAQYYTMVSPQTILNAGKAEKVNGTHFSTYGLGWFLKDFNGMKIITHGGGLPGFHSKVTFVPEDSLAYVILGNQISYLVEALDRKILDYYIGDNERDWAQLYLEAENASKAEDSIKTAKRHSDRVLNTSPSLEKEAYVGIYEDKSYGKASVETFNGELVVTLLPTKELFNSPMEHWQYDTFRIKWKDQFLPEGFVTFNLDSKGQISYFTIELENPDFHFDKLKFEKLED